MAHTRIRKFNTRDTYPEQNLDNDLCQAVVARGRMFSSAASARRISTRRPTSAAAIQLSRPTR
jgi:hypothetical protein